MLTIKPKSKKTKLTPVRRHNKPLIVIVGILASIVGLATLAVTQASSALPLGSIVSQSETAPSCPVDSTCQTVEVTCPEVQLAETAYLTQRTPTGAPRGVIVSFSGLWGTSWLLSGKSKPLMDQLVADGFTVVDVRWATGWPTSAAGENVGPSRLACRPATLVNWVYETKYLPLNITVDKIGKCGFCAVGYSGGAAQITYALSHYGLDGILNAIIPVSGPPYAALAKGCLPPETTYTFSDVAKKLIDNSYGYSYEAGGGPCQLQNSEYQVRWDADSVDTGGNQYNYANTRVHLIIGDQDIGMLAHGADYFAALQAAGSPYTSQETVAGVGHELPKTEAGQSAIRLAVLADTGATIGTTPPEPPPPPPPDDTTAPSAPTNLAATATAKQVTLSWTASSDDVGVVKYLVQRGGITIAEPATTSYIDKSVVARTSYTYQVLAVDAAGNISPASNQVTITTRR